MIFSIFGGAAALGFAAFGFAPVEGREMASAEERPGAPADRDEAEESKEDIVFSAIAPAPPDDLHFPWPWLFSSLARRLLRRFPILVHRGALGMAMLIFEGVALIQPQPGQVWRWKFSSGWIFERVRVLL